MAATVLDTLIPPGMLMPTAATLLVVPPGWLLCDGSAVSRRTYAALYDAVGIAYGVGDGATTFNLPNLKGRVIVGQDAGQTEFDVLGETGGSKTSTAPHTHDLASHSHTLTSSSISDNTSDGPAGNASGYVANPQGWQGADRNHYHGIGHYHTGYIGNHLWAGNGVHNGHYNHGGFTAEAPEPFSNWASGPPLNIDGTARAAPNGDNASGWMSDTHFHGLENHNHDLQSHTHTMKNHTHSGTSAGPNNNTSGASSAAVTSGNLQPYLTMNYLIKT
jgi:microcystin-dependent protein